MRTDTEQTVLREVGLGLILILVFAAGLEAGTEELKKAPVDRPTELHTGVRSGRVVDAVTGRPIEGAIVVCIWDLYCFSIEGGSVPGTKYETTTDKNGVYSIPDQTVEKKTGTLCSIGPEQVIVYKFGYIWYEVVEDRVKSFVTVLPHLKKIYRQQDNLVKLEPWVEQMSHAEHMRLIGGLFFKPGPLLEEALKEERALVEPPKSGSGETYRRLSQEKAREMREAKRLFDEGKTPQEDYAAQMREQLRSPYRSVRNLAASELKRIGDVESIGILFDILRSKVYSFGFKTALSKLNSRIGRWDMENTFVVQERLKMIEEMEDWWERNKDLSEPERLGDILLNGWNERGKSKVAEMLFKVVDASVVPYLQRFLESQGQTANLQQYVLRMVSQLGDKRLIPQVRQKLLSPDVYIRRQAALTLSKLGDSRGVCAMIASLKSKRRNSRSVANATLKELTGRDFSDGKSLRALSLKEEAEVIEKWMKWWGQNKALMGEIDLGDFSTVMEKEQEAIVRRHAALAAAEAENPDAPVIDDPEKSPKAVFAAYKQAVLAGDVDKALSYFAPIFRIEKEGSLRQLLNWPGYKDDLSEIYFDECVIGPYEYIMPLETDMGFFSSRFTFVTDRNGKWIISYLI